MVLEQRVREARQILRDALREGPLTPSGQVEDIAFREIGLLYGAELSDDRRVVNDETDFGIQREGADVDVGRAEERDGIIHGQVFRVEKTRAIEMDVDARGEEIVVIGSLRELLRNR
jgi:hypothetical protein